MSAAIFGALKYLPASVARKALTKFNPKFENYFSKAISYGIDANRALDYLSQKFESDSQKAHRSQLDQGASNKTLRPDEAVSRSEMSNAGLPGKILKGAASLAIGGGLGGLGSNSEESKPAVKSKEMKKVQAMQEAQTKIKKKKQTSELNRESLMEQAQMLGKPKQDEIDDAIIQSLEKILRM